MISKLLLYLQFNSRNVLNLTIFKTIAFLESETELIGIASKRIVLYYVTVLGVLFLRRSPRL